MYIYIYIYIYIALKPICILLSFTSSMLTHLYGLARRAPGLRAALCHPRCAVNIFVHFSPEWGIGGGTHELNDELVSRNALRRN